MLTICSLTLLLAAGGEDAPPPEPISIDREWDVLSPGPPRQVVAQAGEKLGDWSIQLSGLELTGERLTELAAKAPGEPFVRVVRESFKRPVDLDDFLYFLDDVLAAGEEGRRGELVFVTAGRARSRGVLLHPDDVFRKGRARVYGRRYDDLAIHRPERPEELPPAKDGDVLGPNWSARFENPATEEARLAIITERSPRSTFPKRLRSLVEQLRAQGTEVWITSTVRLRERGYLMWGAFILSRADSKAEVEQRVRKLDHRNKAWGLNIPIRWRHPDGWQATVSAALAMAEAYDVVYATEKGARSSNHYGADAVDVVAVGLPRELTLEAPDGAERTFDLSDPSQPRDVSLTPELITWIENHFGLRKLKLDYPHWSDAQSPPDEEDS